MEVNSSAFEHPIIIHYRTPWWLFYIYFITYVLAIYCILQTAFLPQIKFIFVVFLAYGLCNESKSHFQLTKHRKLITLHLDKLDNWMIVCNDRKIKVKLISIGFYSSSLIVLTFSDNNKKRHSFVITSEILDKDSLRRLRVRLLYPI